MLFSSVASFFGIGGGGARPPNVPTKNMHIIYNARASEASERLKNIFSGLKNTSAYNDTYTVVCPAEGRERMRTAEKLTM